MVTNGIKFLAKGHYVSTIGNVDEETIKNISKSKKRGPTTKVEQLSRLFEVDSNALSTPPLKRDGISPFMVGYFQTTA